MTNIPEDPLQSVDQMLRLLDAGFPNPQSLPHEELRALIAARAAEVTNENDVREARDHLLPGGLALRSYHPHGQSDKAPAILFLHGGGWVFCGINSHDGFCRRLARETGAVVLAVDYRLAPEHPFPAAPEDAGRALDWLTENATALGVDPSCIIAMGDSAGGNLAAALCLQRRGAGIAGQVLLYPVLDMDFTTEGYRRFGTGHYNTTDNMRWYWRQYLGGDVLPDPPWAAAPLRAPALVGMPPAVIVVPGRDPTCSEGLAWGRALRAAGVGLRLRYYPDMFHGFLTMLAFAPAEGPRGMLWADIRALISDRKGMDHEQ